MAMHGFKKMPLASKSGGGKLEPVATKGNKGIPSSGDKPAKSQLGKVKGNIDSPSMKGDMGVGIVKAVKGKGSAWASTHD